jgi:predicted nucleotidyltransferase
MVEIPNNIILTINLLLTELRDHNIVIDKSVLFGSYAKGTYNEFSDIDLALVSESFSGNRFLDKEKIRPFIVKINTDISPMPFRPEDFNSDNIFASEIMKYGIIIN